ncbi:beta-galactosidase trimerization domain-containing protein [Paenibacillus sp. CC-CFT747]|nr:beta-galactosidase trimerization domain-containing protein [Paenibacillus sp. CC-CFT747]
MQPRQPYDGSLPGHAVGRRGFLGGDLRTLPVWKPAATALLLEAQAGGKPYCVAIAGRQSPWSRYLLTPAETWLAHAMAVAHGAWTWYGVYNDNNRDTRMQTVREINAFLKEHEEWYTGTSSAARIGLVWSYATANYYQTTAAETDFTDAKTSVGDRRKNDSRKAFHGWFDILSRSRIPFDLLDDTSLTDGSLSRYEAMILPGVSCLSASEAQAVRRYVSEGGKLIATFDTGFYDEYGRPLETSALSDVFGLEGDTAVRVCQYDHVPVPEGEELFRSVDQTLLPAPGLVMEGQAAADALSIGFYREPQVSRYCELPPAAEHPFAIRNRFGEGTCLYLTGNADTMYADYSLPEYRTMLGEAAAAMSAPQVEVEFEAELESVQLSLRHKDESLILHLINYTGSMTRPLTGILRQRDVAIRIKDIPEGEWAASALRSGEALPVTRLDGGLAVRLPELDEYEVIVFSPVQV